MGTLFQFGMHGSNPIFAQDAKKQAPVNIELDTRY